jgi:hypothetical protein
MSLVPLDTAHPETEQASLERLATELAARGYQAHLAWRGGDAGGLCRPLCLGSVRFPAA